MSRLLAELRRRNVFRVAAAYLVVGWLVLQVVGAIEASAGLPSWTDGFALVLLVTGFPIVLFIAWAFELTPEGMKKTEAGGESVGFRPLGPSDYVLIAAVVVVIGIGGAQFVTRGPAPTSSDEVIASRDLVDPARPAPASIAVLPFADLSPEGDQAYFGDGIAEEILNVLTRVDGLHVASRTSAFQFRGDELGIPAIAQELNVRHILEGSVRKAGNTLRITAQLIDSENDRHLWSETFDRPLTAENIFAIQDEIATEIVSALSEALGIPAPEIAVAAGTENLDAYELFLRGQAIFHSRSADTIPEGIDQFERAVAADPDFARGWAGLAAMYSVREGWLGPSDERDFDALALAAANRATALDPDLALPFSVRGILAYPEGRWTEAIVQLNDGISRDPTSADSWYFRGYAWLISGFFDAASADFETCLERDPAYAICRRHLAFAELYRGHTDRALELYEQGILERQNSNNFIMVPVYFARGDQSAAILNLAYALERSGVGAYLEATYRFQTDFSLTNEAVNQMLRTVYLRQNGSLDGFNGRDGDYERPIPTLNSHDLVWSPFSPDRFRPASRDAFLAARRAVIFEMGLPAFWREHGYPPQCEAVGRDDFECGWIDDPEIVR
ncbi:hypothetical protein [Hyphobacterium indicum]|uniref:hypothetical protein n=1 Tax=Hyphobacterium indicum TaxID=2162714 RepID=UPI000D6464C9|nr:hypothetical protein [Hyphobacterium indicum]